MLDVALLIITLTTHGEVRLSVTETVNIAACQHIRTTVVGVLTQRETQVLAARCGANQLALTPYTHGARDADYRYHYGVTLLADQDYQLEYFTSLALCAARAASAANMQCVTASQAPLVIQPEII